MSYRTMILLCCSLCCCSIVRAQKELARIVSRMQSADSVVLVSHEYFLKKRSPGYIAGDTSRIVQDTSTKSPELLLNGKLNLAIIKEICKLEGAAIDSLADLLKLPWGKYRQYSSCFMPHHAILVYQGAMVSYLDICFRCKNYRTSGIRVEFDAIDLKVLDKLKQFFVERGLHYEMY